MMDKFKTVQIEIAVNGYGVRYEDYVSGTVLHIMHNKKELLAWLEENLPDRGLTP